MAKRAGGPTYPPRCVRGETRAVVEKQVVMLGALAHAVVELERSRRNITNPREDEARAAAEKKKKTCSILDESWERYLAATRPKSPSPPRAPLGPLADSDAESLGDAKGDEDATNGISGGSDESSEDSGSTLRASTRPGRRKIADSEESSSCDEGTGGGARLEDEFATSGSNALLRSWWG